MKLIVRTTLMIAVIFSFVPALAQQKDLPKGWHLLDAETNGYHGISMDKAYRFVRSQNIKSTPVIVAVIDTGIDTAHEDLRPILWRNPKEIPGNGIDDDNNGYIDDIHGWNFLGGRDGRNVEKDSYEASRVYHGLKEKWGGEVNEATLSPADKKEYQMWKRAKKEIVGEQQEGGSLDELRKSIAEIKYADSMIRAGDAAIRQQLGKDEYTCKDLADFNSSNLLAKRVKLILTSVCKDNKTDEISNTDLLQDLEGEIDELESNIAKHEAAEKAPFPYRADIVKDNYEDINDRFYGNNNLTVSRSGVTHGTHVAGIIAAVRGNDKGVDGVADNVRIMAVRALPPGGDEHDKDMALAIRYAVDNGAKVINMSFGKGYSPQKRWMDEAIQYAEERGVLLIHAAGNEAKNIDTTYNYPMPLFENGKRPTNWITVGASGDPVVGGFVANFSNYGKREVDVFAPGVRIYSTVGNNGYQSLQGTSMAAPVVAGLAAFILQYYPTLTPSQVKYAIEKSAIKPGQKVKNPETGEEVSLGELCRTGGVINAYEAIKLASTLKPETRPVRSKVKSKVKG